MILRDGRAKIMDFGIARIAASDVKTQTGVLMGSPKYMSPEQVQGRPADARSDLFSLGVVLHEMLCGAPPFTGDDVSMLMYNVAHADPPPPSAVNAAVPRMLDLIVARALAKSPEQRYSDAAQMAADLRACAQAPPRDAGTTAATVALAATTLRPGAAMADDRTLPLRPPATAGAQGLARGFDGAAALRRLEARIAGGGGDAQPRARGRPPLSAGDRVIAAVAITISAVLAALIAFR
jgi:serine/threonine-protein kinase